MKAKSIKISLIGQPAPFGRDHSLLAMPDSHAKEDPTVFLSKLVNC